MAGEGGTVRREKYSGTIRGMYRNDTARKMHVASNFQRGCIGQDSNQQPPVF